MNPLLESDWNPDPQLLAAYFDGELEGRDEMADVRARIETWLQTNPDAVGAWAAHRELQQQWRDTTPPEPTQAMWAKALQRIDAGRRQPNVPVERRRPWLTAGLVAAMVLFVCGLLFWRASSILNFSPEEPVANLPKAPLDLDDSDVFAVATAGEVTILRVNGDDAEALVVGELPLDGPLELASPGDVLVTSSRCPRTNVRQKGPARPMVWARLDAE
ncbi:MAG: hypothetical protein HYX68_26355 [Planctomycetes bacterium]|nr:hypothetical protein [Planctomycetota bacterium]